MYGKCTYIDLMGDAFSIDEQILSDRKSSYLVRVTGKIKRDGLRPGDILVIDRNLPHEKEKLAVIVRNNKFGIEKVTEDFIRNNDPENGDFIWGMVKAVVRELS
jgi:SOS-response transcriptional repressor LexA